jgi:hypothetical protein
MGDYVSRAVTDIHWINYSLIKISLSMAGVLSLSLYSCGHSFRFNLFKFSAKAFSLFLSLSFAPIRPRNYYYRNNYHKAIYCFVYGGSR